MGLLRVCKTGMRKVDEIDSYSCHHIFLWKCWNDLLKNPLDAVCMLAKTMTGGVEWSC